jgi:hypothetical protein
LASWATSFLAANINIYYFIQNFDRFLYIDPRVDSPPSSFNKQLMCDGKDGGISTSRRQKQSSFISVLGHHACTGNAEDGDAVVNGLAR